MKPRILLATFIIIIAISYFAGIGTAQIRFDDKYEESEKITQWTAEAGIKVKEKIRHDNQLYVMDIELRTFSISNKTAFDSMKILHVYRIEYIHNLEGENIITKVYDEITGLNNAYYGGMT